LVGGVFLMMDEKQEEIIRLMDENFSSDTRLQGIYLASIVFYGEETADEMLNIACERYRSRMKLYGYDVD
jgi:hypothetical protein